MQPKILNPEFPYYSPRTLMYRGLLESKVVSHDLTSMLERQTTQQQKRRKFEMGQTFLIKPFTA
jgi:hypothetical protein